MTISLEQCRKLQINQRKDNAAIRPKANHLIWNTTLTRTLKIMKVMRASKHGTYKVVFKFVENSRHPQSFNILFFLLFRSRLRECCEAFGAAPTYPDYLDASCTVRFPGECLALAERAMRTLLKIQTVAFSQFQKRQFRAIHAAQSDLKLVDICSSLLRWSNNDAGPSGYSDGRGWLDDITAIAKVPREALDKLLDDTEYRNIDDLKEAWYSHSGQRQRGFLQEEKFGLDGASSQELRAAGEYELLLAESLTFIPNQNPSETSSDLDSNVRSEIARALSWRKIYTSAISHMIPAAALLRQKRKPHPFSLKENNEDPYNTLPLHFSEPFSVVTCATSQSLTGIINESLSMLGTICLEGEDSVNASCHAVASHLLCDSDSFSDIKGLLSIKAALTGIKAVQKIAGSLKKKDSKNVLPFFVERLVSIIEEFGASDTAGGRDLSDETFVKSYERLYCFLGASRACLIDTVAEGSVDVLKILKAGKLKESSEDRIEAYRWSDQDSRKTAIFDVVSMLCDGCLYVNQNTRSMISRMISRVGILESQSSETTVIPAIIDAFNALKTKNLKSIIVKDLPGAALYGKDLATVLSLLLSNRGGPPYFDKAKFVHDSLMTLLDSWGKIDQTSKVQVLRVMLTYGTHFNSLVEIGAKLLEKSRQDSAGEAVVLSTFFESIQKLQQDDPKRSDLAISTNADNVSKGPIDFPHSCSFAQKSGFHGKS